VPRFEKALYLANGMILALIAYVCVRPGGVVRVAASNWLEERATRRQIVALWPSMSASGGRLDQSVAKVMLVEFADYQCPFCRLEHTLVDSLLAQNSAIGIVYRHFPLPSHSAAPGAARAAICAQQQGRFREMNRQLFETDQWMRDSNWVREAHVAGVKDIANFTKCLSSPQTTERLRQDVALGEAIGIRGTPTFVSPTDYHLGVFSGEQSLLGFLRLR
jgi:protein-disulfide isomerase